MAKPDYYRILGTKRTDDMETIKKAYRRLAKESHPDLHPGDGAAEARFKEISEAWEVLSDPVKRKAYDEELAGAAKAGGSGKPFTPGPAGPGPAGGKGPVKMDQATYESMMRGFDNILSPDKIKERAAQQNRGRNPLDTTSMFEQYMGFRRPGKK